MKRNISQAKIKHRLAISQAPSINSWNYRLLSVKPEEYAGEQSQGSKPSFQIDSAIIAAVVKQILSQDDEKLRAALLPSLLCEVVYSKNHSLIHELLKENVDFNVSVVYYTLRCTFI